jgi:hypothetical protein
MVAIYNKLAIDLIKVFCITKEFWLILGVEIPNGVEACEIQVQSRLLHPMQIMERLLVIMSIEEGENLCGPKAFKQGFKTKTN